MKRPIAAFTILAAAAAAIVPLTASALTTKPTVAVQLAEFNVVPAVQSAKPGKVTFVVKNTGKLEHEFVVVKTAKPAGSILKGAEADETGAAGEIGSVPTGTQKKVTLTLAAGHYALICNIAGHYKGGQFADFYVR